LKLIRVKLEDEVQDLTASVFEEANKMVQKAHGQTVTAQKQITAANEEIDALKTKVLTLKAVTSSNSKPIKSSLSNILNKSFQKKEIKKIEDCEINYLFYKEFHEWVNTLKSHPHLCECLEDRSAQLRHLSTCKIFQQSKFLSRILTEDINPCLEFTNDSITTEISTAIHSNQLCIEPLTSFKRICALTRNDVICKYKLRLNDLSDDWMPVSALARQRVGF